MANFTKETLNKIFKAYDIRGRYPEDLSEELFYHLGRAYAVVYKPQKVVVGHDIRPESLLFKKSLIKGLLESGVAVEDMGEIATEILYFAVGEFNDKYDGGMIITASHNPQGWNGCKMVDKNVQAIGSDSGLDKIAEVMLSKQYIDGEGSYAEIDIYPSYKAKIRSFLKSELPKDLYIVVDAGNGIGGKIYDYVFGDLGVKVEKMYFETDGTFPNHVPNPLEEENVVELKARVLESGADLGISIDGDADRIMFVDKKGRRPDGVYSGVLLAKHLCKGRENPKVIQDPRITWPFQKELPQEGITPIVSVAGHSYFKRAMRQNDAVFGAEMSAHYFFKDFYYADGGIIALAIILDMLACGLDITSEVDYLYEKYPNSGEVNYVVEDVPAVLKKVEDKYNTIEAKISHIDGISVEFEDWRFNLRSSNTQPLIRLNVEGKSKEIIVEKFLEIESVIASPRENLPALKELL